MCFNEEAFIESVLDNILAQDYPKEQLEVFVVDGLSTDRTPEIVDDFAKTSALKITRLENTKRTVPYGLNLGISQATGDYVVRMDAHASYPSNYLSTLVGKAMELGSDNIGVVLKTVPGADTAVAKTIAFAISHPFGIGNSSFRTGTNEVKAVDTVPFGCFRRGIFDRVGIFDTELTRNQDDEFNARIIANHGKVHLLPSPTVTYYARINLKAVSRMYYQYGLFKPLVNRKIGTPATIRQFAPPLFVLGLIGGLLGLMIWPWFGVLLAVLIPLHLILGIIVWIANPGKLPKRSLIFLPITLLIIHLSYGFGYLHGIVRFLILRLDPQESVNDSR